MVTPKSLASGAIRSISGAVASDSHCETADIEIPNLAPTCPSVKPLAKRAFLIWAPIVISPLCKVCYRWSALELLDIVLKPALNFAAMNREPIDDAIRRAGSATALAEVLGITSSAISQWRKCPVERVLDIERATGVSRHDLRPDIYPEPAPAAAE